MKYPISLKIKAGQLFSQRDENGNKVYTIKKLASELGVDFQTALYLEYQGRKLLGTLPKQKKVVKLSEIRKKKRGHYNTSRTAPSLKATANFVEENIYPRVPRKTSVAEIVYYVAITTAVCFVLGTLIINWVVGKLA